MQILLTAEYTFPVFAYIRHSSASPESVSKVVCMNLQSCFAMAVVSDETKQKQMLSQIIGGESMKSLIAVTPQAFKFMAAIVWIDFDPDLHWKLWYIFCVWCVFYSQIL